MTQAALETAAAWGAGAAAVVGTAQGLPPPFAALVNGASAHALDLDDYDEPANSHPSAVLFPALLALLAERERPGSDLLDAYVLGLEIIQRLGEALNMSHYNLGWHSTATLGSLGAAAACARLQGLDAIRTANALSLATSMATGYVSQIGSQAKPIQAGLAAKNGVLAAGLATAGVTGNAKVLDGPVSLASRMVEPGQADFGPALARLGRPWSIEAHGLAVKAYPSCGYTHRTIDGALALRRDHGLTVADIASAELSLPDFHLAILPFQVPETGTQGLFSPAWCAAVAFSRGKVTVEDFAEDALADPALRDLAARIVVSGRVPKDRSRNLDPEDPDRISVVLRDGQVLETAVPLPLGAAAKPLTAAQLEAKFFNCATRRVSRARAEEIRDRVTDLAQAESVAPLLTLLAV